MNVFPIIGYTPLSTVSVDFSIDPRLLITTCEWAPFGDCNNPCGAHPGGKIYIYLANPEFETRSAVAEQRGPGGEVAGLIVYYTYSNGKLKFVWSQPYLVNTNAFNTTPISTETCRPSFPTQALGEIVISNFVGSRTTIAPIVVPAGFTASDLPGRYTPNIRNEQECIFSWVRGAYAILTPVDPTDPLPELPFIPDIGTTVGPFPLASLVLPQLILVRVFFQSQLMINGVKISSYGHANDGSGGPVGLRIPPTIETIETLPAVIAAFQSEIITVVANDPGYVVANSMQQVQVFGDGDASSVIANLEIAGRPYSTRIPLPEGTPDNIVPIVILTIVGIAIIATVVVIASGGTATPIATIAVGTASRGVVAAAAAQGAAAGTAAGTAATSSGATAAVAAAAAEAASIAAQREAVRQTLSAAVKTASVVKQAARGF